MTTPPPAHFDLPAGSRLLVAMSGGVDSSVTAALAKEAGYEVVGVTLQLYNADVAPTKLDACCAGRDIRDARAVADRIGAPHYVLDFEQVFHDEVIAPFADAYVQGLTPIPCVACNKTVKFRDLIKVARDLGADAVATGHYAQRIEAADGPALLRGADPKRDQSYFLYVATRDQMQMLRFPLGGMSKDQTRAHAARLGLAVQSKPDSQDICFVPQGDYVQVVRRLRPDAAATGEIVHRDGRVLGTHPGIAHFTIGQRRGLGVSLGPEPLYVVALDAAQNRVIVGPRQELGRSRVLVDQANWLIDPVDGLTAQVKLRSMRAPQQAVIRLDPQDPSRFETLLAAPEFGVAPGQACVVYDGDRVLGGGRIIGAV